jgi:DNA-binding Xre family transcriptional regulator
MQRRHHRLEQLAQKIGVAKPAVARLAKGRVVLAAG